MKPNTVGCVGGDRPAERHDARANGLLAGAQILTLEGELPVEYLEPGDRIITRDRGMAVLRAITRTRGLCPLVLVRHGALGHRKPGHDSTVPASQKLLLRDGRAAAFGPGRQALVAAAALVDEAHVLALPAREVVLFQLHFDAEHILYVDGLELASAPPCPEARLRAA